MTDVTNIPLPPTLGVGVGVAASSSSTTTTELLPEKNEKRQWQHTNFKVLEKVGEGFSATVFQAIDTTCTGGSSGEVVYALKHIEYRYSSNKS